MMSLSIPIVQQQISFSKSLSTPQCLFLPIHNNHHLSSLSHSKSSTIIRMGRGRRTYPGGVSKWQWKRMQANKAKKAGACRERQMYEMRKRAELKAAVSELERPWEVVERAPNLFSVRADEQVKVLADRFQKPGGFDMLTENDGPQLFETPDELPCARFFPKGVVHSVKPYRKINDLEDPFDGFDGSDGECSGVNGVDEFDGKLRKKGNGRKFFSKDVDGSDGECSSAFDSGVNRVGVADGKLRKKGNGRKFLSKDVYWSDGECSPPLNSGMNGVSVGGRLRQKGNNGRKFFSRDVDGYNGEGSSPLSYGMKDVNFDGRLRKKGSNGRKFFSKDVDGSDGKGSPPLNSGMKGVSVGGRLRQKGNNGRKFFTRDGSNGEGSSPLGSGMNGVNFDGRLRKKGNGRKFLSKDVDGSGGLRSGRVGSGRLRSGRVGSGRKQSGSNSIAGSRGGKYSRGTSGYASPKAKDADSEVYDMGLQQDGSYGFLQNSEQSDSKCW